MGFVNPYIEKVEEFSGIFLDSQKMMEKRGSWSSFFENDYPIHLEIGTGMGNFFAGYADANRDVNLIGMEIKYKRLYRTMEKCHQIGRDDIVLLKEYGEKISQIFGSGELSKVFLYFPDPWPKKRHRKHRIIQDRFLDDLHDVLCEDGTFDFKTDHEGYFEWTQEHFSGRTDFEIVELDEDFESEKKYSHENSTEFEMIWRTQGKRVMRLVARKNNTIQN